MQLEPRSAKGRRTRARLLEAGKRVFERDGFLQARITDIAAEAEVSHGSFYHYFDSKESLFREIAEQVEVRLVSMDDISQTLGPDAGPIDRIRAANYAYLSAYKKEARIMRVIEEVSRYNEDVRAVRTKRDDYLAVRLESAIRRLQAEGLADKRVDERYAAAALGGMVAKFAEMTFVAGARFDLDTAVEQLTLLWANALGLRAGADGDTRPGDGRASGGAGPTRAGGTTPRIGRTGGRTSRAAGADKGTGQRTSSRS